MDNCKEKIDLGHYWDLRVKGLTLGIITGIHSKETFYQGCQDNPQVQLNKSDKQRKQHRNCLVNVSMDIATFFSSKGFRSWI